MIRILTLACLLTLALLATDQFRPTPGATPSIEQLEAHHARGFALKTMKGDRK